MAPPSKPDCSATFSSFGCCCGADTVNGIYNSKPEVVLEKWIKTMVLKQIYNRITHLYEDGSWKLNAAFMLWAGPDYLAGPHKGYYEGPKNLAAYIRDNNLGTMLQTSHKPNPMHSERKPGDGDLVIYIWEIDGTAIRAWWEKRQVPPPLAEVANSLQAKGF